MASGRTRSVARKTRQPVEVMTDLKAASSLIVS
jgi:hypothetical protein